MTLPEPREESEDTPLGPSKSQRKREASALQALGEKLVELAPAQLQTLPLPDELREAVDVARGIASHGARKRQLQYIGKLMRRIDPEPLRAALAAAETQGLAVKRQHHAIEHWRAALLTGEAAPLADFIDRYPQADRQHLRQLVRAAGREQAEGKPPAARRALFRYLRELIEQAGTAAERDSPG